jgi:hypothetical protein
LLQPSTFNFLSTELDYASLSDHLNFASVICLPSFDFASYFSTSSIRSAHLYLVPARSVNLHLRRRSRLRLMPRHNHQSLSPTLYSAPFDCSDLTCCPTSPHKQRRHSRSAMPLVPWFFCMYRAVLLQLPLPLPVLAIVFHSLAASATCRHSLLLPCRLTSAPPPFFSHQCSNIPCPTLSGRYLLYKFIGITFCAVMRTRR